MPLVKRPLHVLAAFSVLFSTVLFAFLTGCHKKPQDGNADAPLGQNAELLLADPSAKERWIMKASRKLRHGVEPTTDQIAAWLPLAPQDVLTRMLETKEAGDGSLDFILYFLGFKDDKLTLPTGKPTDASVAFDVTRSHSIAAISVAVDAALKMNRGEDFLTTLAELKGTFYASPLPFGKTRIFGQEADLDAQVKGMFQNLRAVKQSLHAMQVSGKVDPEICTLTDVNAGGITPQLAAYLDAFLWENTFGSLERIYGNFGCNRPSTANASTPSPPKDLPFNFAQIVTSIDQIVKTADQYEAQFTHDKYAPTSINELKPLEFPATILSRSSESLSTEWFWTRERNSSTNRNRKRAAYVLKRFFCDDLTPIGVEVPAQHSGDQHASDPGCVSCHYKLDPMAGFFRKLGRLGEQKPGATYITFDDFALTPAKAYFESWKNSEGAYDIGYIRSRSDKTLNAYPAHPDDPEFSDLVGILKTAPEVKRCVVKRAFQYLAGEELALDRGYQSELEGIYSAEPNGNSSLALKSVMKTIALSYSFVRDTSERGTCYDFPANYDPTGKPACEINFIVEQNCAESCHSKASASGGLDMSGWTTPTALGAPGGFIHTKSSGERLSYADSLTKIAERLNTTDNSERMPLSKNMNPVDRETLYLWTQSQLRSFK